MFFTANDDYLEQVARQEFDRKLWQGALNSTWARLMGRRHQLLDVSTSVEDMQVKRRNDAGLQLVATDKIVGSEGRSHDFDPQWRPLRKVSQGRWVSISAALAKDTNMPAIDLIKVGDRYFVRDGHHRVSVAKARGQLEMEANVVVWHADEVPEVDVMVNKMSAGATTVSKVLSALTSSVRALRQKSSAVAGEVLPNSWPPLSASRR